MVRLGPRLAKRRVASAGSRSLVALIAFSPLAFAGCGSSGPRTYRVSGDVRWQAKAVDQGDIIFEPANPKARPVASKIRLGHYELRSEAGPAKVRIFASRPGEVDPVMQAPVMESFIPRQFNVDSSLNAEVQANDHNRIDFDLPTK